MLFKHVVDGCVKKAQPRAKKDRTSNEKKIPLTTRNFELEVVHWNVRSIRSANKLASVMDFIHDACKKKPGYTSLVETHLDKKSTSSRTALSSPPSAAKVASGRATASAKGTR